MSSSPPGSSMEEVDRRQNGAGEGRRRNRGGVHGGDPEAWSAFAESFSQVQTVLDRNRELIQQANQNHQSRMPDNMAKNVAIINELNGNMSKVASIYSDLSVNFADKVRHHRVTKDGGGGRRNGS